MRILVTNDDGIDSVGLHVLARSMQEIADVVIVAPDDEYSGSSASFGSLLTIRPEVHRTTVDGVDEAWTVSGPPALCVLFARLGIVGDWDLVVSGINPGANVGRSVYHSGTVGACTTARSGGKSGLAVSQEVESWGVEGQGWESVLDKQQWQGAADCAQVMARALLADLPEHPVVVNLNVTNVAAADMKGWRRTEVGTQPPRSMSKATLEPKQGHENAYHVKMEWGDALELPEHTDGGAVMAGYASVSWLGALDSVTPDPTVGDAAESALDRLLSR
ncbi:MAG: 5'/3'-nucleotidase SurE [Ilumatobacteraceae bacterium]